MEIFWTCRHCGFELYKVDPLRQAIKNSHIKLRDVGEKDKCPIEPDRGPEFLKGTTLSVH